MNSMRGTAQNGWPFAPFGLKNRRPSKWSVRCVISLTIAGLGQAGMVIQLFTAELGVVLR
jgi:hypothetical protein